MGSKHTTLTSTHTARGKSTHLKKESKTSYITHNLITHTHTHERYHVQKEEFLIPDPNPGPGILTAVTGSPATSPPATIIAKPEQLLVTLW